jgi:hypothetical protein
MASRPARSTALALLGALAALGACSKGGIYTQAEPRPDPRANGAPSIATATLGVPPGRLPPPGFCRVWFPGRPPGHQPKAGPCADVEVGAPAGSWVLYRPSQDKKVVHVRYVHERRAGVVVWIRVFDVKSGAFVRDVTG